VGFGDHGNAGPNQRSLAQLVADVEETFVEIDIESLLDEVSDLITQNQIAQLKVQKDIAKLELIISNEVEELQILTHEILKKMALRRINVRKKHLKRMEKITTIYHDNIDLHYSLNDRLEEARIAGRKSITAEQLEELTCDFEEQKTDHDELINSAKFLLQATTEGPEPELEALAKELGIET